MSIWNISGDIALFFTALFSMCDCFHMHTPNVLATNWDRKTEQASVFN